MNPNNTNSIVMQNPLETPEILNHILGYIKGTETLLNCRLVAHSWNHLAVQFLNNKCCTIAMDSNNIHQYIDLLKSNANSNLSNLNANLRINFPQQFSSEGSEYEREGNEFKAIVQLLLTSKIQVIGLNLTTSPRALSFKTPILATTSRITDGILQQLLEHVAPTLCHLKLNGPMKTSINNYEPPTFPNLTSLHCFGSMSGTLCEYLTTSIVNSWTLKLKSLELITNDSREINPIFNRLKSSEDLNLGQLELSVDDIETYNELCAFKSCHLKRLVLHLQTRSIPQPRVVINLFGNLVRNNYPNLTTIELHPTKGDNLTDYFVYNNFDGGEPLPQITTFGFYLKIFNDSIGYDFSGIMIEKYLRLLNKFPCLITIKLDVEAMICLANHFIFFNGKSPSGGPSEFDPANFVVEGQPLVSTMEVCLNLCCYGQDVDGSESSSSPGLQFNQRNRYRTINCLLAMFWPNVKNLTLKQKLLSKASRHPKHHGGCMDSSTYPHVPHELLKAIITPWKHNGLRRLRIKNYIGDWLNTIIATEEGEEEGNITRALSNLELLSIHGGGKLSSNFDVDNVLQNLRFVNDKKGRFDLLHFLERIQSVAEIEVDEALLPNSPNTLLIMEQITTRNLTTNTHIRLI